MVSRDRIIKMTLKSIFLIIVSLSIYACNGQKKTEKISNEIEVDIVNKCLAQLEKDGLKGYVVCPKFQNFELNSILREISPDYNYDERKKKLLDSLNWTEEHFVEIQEKVNLQYLNKNNPDFLKLNSFTTHNNVIFISGIDENLVFVTIVNYCNAVKNSELTLPSFKKSQRYSSVLCYAFILKNRNVHNMFTVGNQVKENQCSSSDIRIDR